VPETVKIAASTLVLERRVRIAALLISLGLLVLLITLVRIHPLAFVAFAVIGFPLVLAGGLVFLYSIIQDTKT
jgi:hypothetical protein